MVEKTNPCNICVYIDNKTRSLIDEYGKKHSISRSATLRLIVNDFFLKNKGVIQ